MDKTEKINISSYKQKQRIIKYKLYEKIWEISDDLDEFNKNCKEYNKLMDNSVEKIKEYLKQQNKQYWNGSTKRYQVLHLMKLNKNINIIKKLN
jgi:hypothetical protein